MFRGLFFWVIIWLLTGPLPCMAELERYTLQPSPLLYNFTTHAYSSEQLQNGIRFYGVCAGGDSVAIVIDSATSATPLIVDLYGADSTFTSVVSTRTGSAPCIVGAGGVKGAPFYFVVRPSTTAMVTSLFRVFKAERCTLSVVADGAGRTEPQGQQLTWIGVPQVVRAYASATTCFSGWSSTDSVTITPAGASQIIVTSEGHAVSVRAAFTAIDVHNITFVRDTFSFAADGCKPLDGVLFRFTPPAADTFHLSLGRGDALYNPSFSWTWYGTDETFTTPDSVTGAGSTIALRTIAPSQSHYVRIRPTRSSDTAASFSIKADSFYVLTIAQPAFGTVVPGLPVLLKSAESRVCTLSLPSVLYTLSGWRTVGGSAAISDTTALTPVIRLDSSDAAIEAVVTRKNIYPLHTTPDILSYATQGTWASGGICAVYTSDAAGSCILEVKKPLEHSNTVYYYGTDSTFTTIIGQRMLTGTNYYTFASPAAGVRHYFRIMPGSLTNQKYSCVTEVYRYYTLTVEQDCEGDVQELLKRSVREDSLFTLTQPVVSGKYYFKNWTVASGYGVIDDSLKTTAKVTIQSDVTIRGVCGGRPAIAVEHEWDTLRYSDVDGGENGGVLFTYTSLLDDSAEVVVEAVDAHTMALSYYDTASECRVVIKSASGTSLRQTLPPAPAQPRYVRVAPASAADSSKRLRFRYFTFKTLTLVAGGDAPFATFGVRKIREESTAAITAPSTGGNYYFSHWHMLSGSARAADSTSMSTSVVVTTDCTIEAVFATRPVIAISTVWDSLSYSTVAGGTRGGVLLSYTAATSDSVTVVFEESAGRAFNIGYFGTDSTIATAILTARPQGAYRLTFAPAVAGETHFIKMSFATAADSNDVVRFKLLRSCRVTCISEDGTVSPQQSTVDAGGTLPIHAATTSALLMFDRWITVTGHATIADSLHAQTTVTVDSVDVTLEALFKMKQVYPLTSFDSVYTYNVHGGVSGVLYRFTAPETGRFAITATPSTNSVKNTLLCFNGDTTFTTAVDSSTGDSSYCIVQAEAGVNYYLLIRAADNTSATGNENYTLRYRNVFSIITSSSTGGRLTSGGNTTLLPDGFTLYDSAYASTPRWYFNYWSTLSGAVAYGPGRDSTSSGILVAPVGSDAVLEATFAEKVIYDLTSADRLFQFSTEGAPGYSVLLRYTAPSADSFTVHLSLPSAYFHSVVTYGADSLYKTAQSTITNSTDRAHTIKMFAPTAGTTCYLRVYTSASYENNTFTARVDTSVTLSLLHGIMGDITPSDTIKLFVNTSAAVSATPVSPRYYFASWRRVAGDITIADSLKGTTTITVRSNGTAEAVFNEKNIHEVDGSIDTLSYAREGAPSGSGGIILSFIAPRADTFALALLEAGTYSRSVNIYRYGTDSLLLHPLQILTNKPKQTITGFRATAPGERLFFRIEPVNSTFYADSIAVTVKNVVSVIITSDGNGTTTPAGTVYVVSGTEQSITAVPSFARYVFDRWSTEIGNVTYVDSLSAATTFRASAPATVRARFRALEIRDIPKAPRSSRYVYTVTEKPGVYMKAFVERSDSFYVWIRHDNPSIKKQFIYYGIDSTFTSVVRTFTLSLAADSLVRLLSAVENSMQYFRVVPLVDNYTDAFTIMWGPYPTLMVTSDNGGTVTPDTPLVRTPGTRVQIETYADNRLFTFKNWTVASGYAAIADTNAVVTSVTIDPRGGGTVHALYAVAPHDTLFMENDGHGITIPVDYLLLDTMKDTIVAAYPDRYYRFDYWEVISGNPQLSQKSGNTARVKCSGTARLKAYFKPDSSAIPAITINSITTDSFPTIALSATLRNPAAYGSTASPVLTLTQDSIPQTISVQTLSDVQGIAVSIVIDRSQTMGKYHRIDTALAAARVFIGAMDPLDKAAIVTFSTGAEVVQPLTGNQASLLASLQRIVPEGETAIRDGAYTGASQLVTETTTRAVIIFSDGFENSSKVTLDSVISFARKNNISIYSIAVGAEAIALVDATLRPLADSTGGSLYYAKSTGDLATLYLKIKQDIESRYIIHYTSPDTVENGGSHSITLAATIAQSVVTDTGSWKEKNSIPTAVIVTVPDTVVSSADSVTVLPVVITGVDSLFEVSKLCYRESESGDSFVCVALEQIGDSLYEAVIPIDSIAHTDREYTVITAGDDTIHIPNQSDTAAKEIVTPDTVTTDGLISNTPVITGSGGTSTQPATTPIVQITTVGTPDDAGKNGNQPPVVIVDEMETVVVGDTVTITLLVLDPDGDSLRYQILSSTDSAVLYLHENGKLVVVLSGRARLGDSIGVVVAVDDGIDTVIIRIMLPRRTDDSRTVTLHADTRDTVVAPGDTAIIAVWADSSDGSEIVSVSGLPEGAVFTPGTDGDKGKLVWIPSVNGEDTIVTLVLQSGDPLSKPDTITIRLRSGVYKAVASLSDTNGNGFIDLMRIEWSGAARLSEHLPDINSWIATVDITLKNGTLLSLEPVAMHKVDSMHLVVVLRENRTAIHTGFSSVNVPLLARSVTVEPFLTKISSVRDAAGPVIVSATVKGGGIGSAAVDDSLIILLSEPVVWKKSSFVPATLLRAVTARGRGDPFNGLGTSTVLSRTAERIIISMQNNYSFIDKVDSIALRTGNESMITDSAGNVVNPYNRTSRIDVAYVDDAALCPNPFVPGRSTDPLSGKTGSRVIVQCRGGALEYRGEVTILNALGNVVVRRKKMEAIAQKERWLTWLWDGRDEQGRVVGNGMYAVKIDLYNDGEKITLYRKVGVVREER